MLTITGASISRVLNDLHSDEQPFVGTPVQLHAGSSASVDNGQALASLAEDIRATWSSPDQGTVDFSFLGSMYAPEPIFGDAIYYGYTQLPFEPMWSYSFTPNVASTLTLDAILTYNGGRGAAFDSGYGNPVFVDGVYIGDLEEGSNHKLIGLDPGHTYTLSIGPGIGYRSSTDTMTVDDISIGTSHIEFSILGDTSGAVPEPATWTLMLAGFGAIGVTMRRKRQQSQFKAAHS